MSLDQTTPAAKLAFSEVMQVSGIMTALAAAGMEPVNVGGHHFVMVPPNYGAKDITDLVEKAQPTPNRKRGTAVLKDVACLLAYCADQAAMTVGYIYADADRRNLTAVFNDHRCDAYDALFKGWRRVDKAAFADGAAKRVESLWLSPNMQAPQIELQAA